MYPRCKMEINQIYPSISCGDAVSNDIIGIREILRDLGYSSEIYAQEIPPKCLNYIKPLSEYKWDRDNIILYHFALLGLSVTDLVKRLPGKKILVYHNITPTEFFERYDSYLGNLCSKGRDELRSLVDYIDLAVGDSEYNCHELKKFGFKHIKALPVVVDVSKYANYDPNLAADLGKDDAINFLFVGRIAPNKRQDDVIKIFYYYNKYINSNSTLYLVGYKQVKKYVLELEDMIMKHNLSDKVFLTGHVDNKKLASYYRNSHIFLCMSEHEGFCVPLVEAMAFGIPVLAFSAAAIPYTLGNAGILLHRKDYAHIAELINIIITDTALREKIVKNQLERSKDFHKDCIRPKLQDIIESLIR
jgi:glycosyltransferase involved in cell wall biosynthesis